MAAVLRRYAADRSAVIPSFVFGSTLAPRPSNRRTFAVSPVAHISAVEPLLLTAFTSAPCSSNSRTVSGDANAAARMSAVAPVSSRMLTSVPDLSSDRTERTSS
jgi:hypothetical protein